MLARAPGAAFPSDWTGDANLNALVGPMHAEASMIWTEAGLWWVWECGAMVPADERAAGLNAFAQQTAAVPVRDIGD
jgi:hypothetical protein